MVKRWRRATGAGSWAFVVSKRASCLEPRALSLVSSIFKRVAAGPNCATVGGNRTSNGPKDDGWSFGRTGRTVTQFRRGGCRPKSPPIGALRRLYQIGQFCHREGRWTEATWNQNTSATLNNAQREINEHHFCLGRSSRLFEFQIGAIHNFRPSRRKIYSKSSSSEKAQ